MKLLIAHRESWGMSSLPLITAASGGRIETAIVGSAGFADKVASADHVMRWAWTGTEGVPSSTKIINKSRLIGRVSNKGLFAKELGDSGLGPRTYLSIDEWLSDDLVADEWLLRKRKHQQGQDITIIRLTEPREAILKARELGEYYIRPRVPKTNEYRVYVLCGKVLQIEEKTVPDPTVVAWGNDRSNFTNVRWGAWDLRVADEAIRAVNLSELHYGAVDVIVTADGEPYVLEVNTGPDLYSRSDGSMSYVQKTMAAGLVWHCDNGWDHIVTDHDAISSYRDLLHPSMQE